MNMNYDQVIDNYAMNVTFQVVDNTRAKAFVNEQFIGNVRIMNYKGRLRLTFRNSDNPFKNFVRLPQYHDLNTSISVQLEDRTVLQDLIPIVIRNFCRNTAFLAIDERWLRLKRANPDKRVAA